MDNDTSNATGNGQAPNQQPPVQATTSEGQAPNETPTEEQKLIADLRAKVSELNKENASHRKAKQDAQQLAQQAEEARLKEQGEYKTLAEKHEARVKELEPLAQSYSQLATLVSGQIETQIKDWPEEVKTFDPGKDAPIEQRLAWIEKSRPLVAKLQVQAQTRPVGNGPNPKPMSGANQQQANVDELRQRMRSTGKYSF